MPEHHPAQRGVGDIPDQLTDLAVGKVAVPGADPLFDGPRALGVRFQQVFVIVRFNKDPVQSAQPLGHAAGHKSGV